MIKLVKSLKAKGYPTSQKHYKSAHEEADKKEKKKFPKGYSKLKKEERHLKKNELIGKNTRSGKIEVEKKFKKYEKEIGYHEKMEHKNLKRIKK
ncbi:MAG TPA: hypothetical protein VKR58_04395 [Aquella sp.]|nr:hypothetical protein [Aquella sp.]